MKDWAFCAFYHKLTRIDKVRGFKGNAFTAFGTAVHCALLEPDTFYDIYHAMPEIGDLRKKENKELKKHEQEKAHGKILLSYGDHERIKGILKNYKKNKLAQHYCKVCTTTV